MVKWKFVAPKRRTKETCFLHLLLHISHVTCFAVFIFPFTDMLLFAHSLTALLYTTDSNFIPHSLLSTLMMEAECGYLATRLHDVMSEKTVIFEVTEINWRLYKQHLLNYKPFYCLFMYVSVLHITQSAHWDYSSSWINERDTRYYFSRDYFQNDYGTVHSCLGTLSPWQKYMHWNIKLIMHSLIIIFKNVSITGLCVPFLWQAAVLQQRQHLHIEDSPGQLVPWWTSYQDCSMVENLRSLPPCAQQDCKHEVKSVMSLALLKNSFVRKYVQHVKTCRVQTVGNFHFTATKSSLIPYSILSETNSYAPSSHTT